MNLTLVANVSKPGRLWIAARKTSEPALTQQQVLEAAATQSTSHANFTGSLAIPSAASRVQDMLCVADGDLMVIYAVAQDKEGDFPPRGPNNSTLTR
jgi:hypothetical protein